MLAKGCPWYFAIHFWTVMACLTSSVMAAPIDGPLPETPKDQPPTRRTPGAPLLESIENAAAQHNGQAVDSPPVDAPPEVGVPNRDLQSAFVKLGNQALKAGNVEECLKQFAAAGEADPTLPPPLLMLAQIYLSNNQWSDGAFALEQSAVAYRSHPELYLTSRRSPKHKAATWMRGCSMKRRCNLAPPDNWPAEHSRRFRISCYVGLAAIAEGREDGPGAIEVFRQWAAIDPENPQLQDRWGRMLFLSGSLDEAFERFAESHTWDESMNPPELSMAAIHTSAGDFAAARTWYEKALATHPQDSRVSFEYGVGLLLAGRADEAKKRMERAVELGADDKQFGANLPLMRGYVAQSLRDYEAAEGFFTAALRLSPGLVPALTQLPLVLVEQDDAAKRERCWRWRRYWPASIRTTRRHWGHWPGCSIGWGRRRKRPRHYHGWICDQRPIRNRSTSRRNCYWLGDKRKKPRRS